MHLGLLTTSYPRFAGDHAGNFVHQMATALVARGHRVTVLAPAPRDREDAEHFYASPQVERAIATEPRPDTPDVHWVRYLPSFGRQTFYHAGAPDNLRRVWAWPGALAYPFAATYAARKLESCDALISHWGIPNALIANIIAHGRPHLAIWHSGDVALLERLPIPHVWARAATRSGRNWFVSDALRRRVAHLAPLTRTHVSPMGAHAVAADRAEARHRLGCTGATLLTMSRLVRIKGIDALLRAVAGLNATLLIAGDGPERNRLQRLASALQVDARFLGHVSAHEKWQAFAAADVFVAPSRSDKNRTEGAPVAIAEAMMLGLPVVATPSAAAALRHEQTGLITHDIRKGVAQLLKDPHKARVLGEAARLSAVAFSWPRIVAELEAMLDLRDGCDACPAEPRNETESPAHAD